MELLAVLAEHASMNEAWARMGDKVAADSKRLLSQSEKSSVILRGTREKGVVAAVRECMEFCNWRHWVPRNSTVVLKPNLCTAMPEQIESSNTKLAVTAAVVEVLLEQTNRISIVEADHIRQTTEFVYEATGYQELERNYGVSLVNLSKMPTAKVPCVPIGEILLPRLLLECDAFISIPVLKTHALTYFTGVLKNQWGCVPAALDRIQHHGAIHEMLASLHRIFHPQFSVVDATVCMEGRGPVAGKPRRLDLILGSQDGVALDATCMRLIGLNPHLSRHVVFAAKQGLGRIEAHDIVVDGDWQKHATQFEPPPKDRLNTLMFKFSKYRWFTKYILGNDVVYYPIRSVVKFLRRVGLVNG
jgi:uncharacterized protein (DUF362 family)